MIRLVYLRILLVCLILEQRRVHDRLTPLEDRPHVHHQTLLSHASAQFKHLGIEESYLEEGNKIFVIVLELRPALQQRRHENLDVCRVLQC